jgi:putative ABC transport system ATP-binding protein
MHAELDSSTTDAIVRATGLRRRFGSGDAAVDAVAGVTLAIEAGAMVAIMGPSGSGKSTLMQLLAGLDRPTAGSVQVGGVALERLADRPLTLLRREKLGFVFQAFNLVPVLTAEENVTLPATLAGRRVDRDWLERLLDAVGLQDRRRHRPAELSGGEQQRVAIARALFTRPAVVFADEPTGALDSGTSAEVIALLRHAVDAFGQTVIIVTHDPDAAAAADRVIRLRDGRIEGDGRAA